MLGFLEEEVFKHSVHPEVDRKVGLVTELCKNEVMDGSWTFCTVPQSTCVTSQGADLLQQTSLIHPASSGLACPGRSMAHQFIPPL